jgi:putative restriction endonuclease
MLLALLELAESGALQENQVRFSPALLEPYARIFALVAGPGDHPNPYFPFLHLRSEGFWHPQPLPGREVALETMRSARSRSDIESNIAFVRLDEGLFAQLADPAARAALREALIGHWFPGRRPALEALLAQLAPSNTYERALRAAPGSVHLDPAAYDVPTRGRAFRRAVLDAYDYRCAASGWRIILPDGTAMAEAAHLVPFAESGNDDPRNGIALAPSYHWALDKGLIAPGPDMCWHVSGVLDPRVPDNRALLDLEGKSLLLPRSQRYRPSSDALQWRMGHLLTG